MYQFHKKGAMMDIFLGKKSRNESSISLADRVDIMTDIYNYCARFDCVPKLTHQLVQVYGRTLIEVKIELHRQNICGIGKGTSYDAAETTAALQFKQEAEKYHAKHGQASIVIKDSTSLTATNAEKFVDFYHEIYPQFKVRLDFTQSMQKVHLENTRHKCQLFIDEKPVGEAVEGYRKKSAESLAYLTAAVTLKRREPKLFPKFIEAWKAGNGNILKTLAPVDMDVDEESLIQMRQTLISARLAGLRDAPDEMGVDEANQREGRYSRHLNLTPAQTEMRNKTLLRKYGEYLRDPRLDKMRRTRSELPISQYSAKVLDLVQNSTYSIIVGATGSGKTTQVPQIILENAISKGEGSACNIICTQPRRIAATSVARRVSDERGQPLQETVGYHVRFGAKLPKARGSITFCTTGIVLKYLQHSPDALMEDISHLIIDEVHERDINTDFLLVILKKIIQQRAAAGRSTPKVVLMSATINTELFAAYFTETTAEGVKVDCPALHVPGRSFPVKEIFLPDIMRELKTLHRKSKVQVIEDDEESTDYLRANSSYLLDQSKTEGIAKGDIAKDQELVIDWKQEKGYSSGGELVDLSAKMDDALVPHGLVAATVAHIVSQSGEGAVLVFLPGIDNIRKVDELLRKWRTFGIDFTDESKFRLHMLHSSIDAAQAQVFMPLPQGCRKIILATNIAETSITIPEVQYVVDTGKLNEKQYDQTRRVSELKCTWISKSSSRQRAGRAGRVQNGHYYALFPRERYDSMRPIGIPEMLRTDLQEICLDIAAQAFRFPVREFLASAIEPPSPTAVDISLRNLEALDAITPEEEITPLGRLLASLPVHPSLGKMIVLGVIFRCLDPMVVIGVAYAERSLFARPLSATEAADKAKLSFVRGSASDLIAMLNAFHEMRKMGLNGPHALSNFANENYIRINTYKAIENTARQIESILVEEGIINRNLSAPTSGDCAQIGGPSLNEYSKNISLIKALVLAGLHPNLAVCKGRTTYRTPGEQNALPFAGSVNFTRKSAKETRDSFGALLSYSNMMRRSDNSGVSLIDTTLSTPMMAVLFGGKISVDRNIITMDGWLKFFLRSNKTACKIILEFRKALERLLSIMFRKLTAREETDRAEVISPSDENMRAIFTHGLVEILNRGSLDEDWIIKSPREQKHMESKKWDKVTGLTPTQLKSKSGRDKSSSRRTSRSARGYI